MTSPEQPPQLEIEPPSLFDRLVFIYRHTPWWTIILGVGLLVALLYMFGDDERRQTMSFLADHPKLTTENKFDVTYVVDTEVLVLQQTVRLVDLENNRTEIALADVIVREPESILVCGDNAAEDCTDRRGTLITYRSYDVPTGAEPDGFVELTGLVVDSSETTLTLQLPDASIVQVAMDRVAEQTVGELACDRALNPECEPLVGDIATVARPYVIREAIEARQDTTVRFLNDGYEFVTRTTFLKDVYEGELSCTDYAFEPCNDRAIYGTLPENIVGVETGRDGDDVLVRTVDQVVVTIDANRVLERRETLVECDTDANPRCANFEGVEFDVSGEVINGRLTQETDVHYFIQREGGSEAFRFVRNDIVQETRTPEDCVDTDQDPICSIRIVMEGETIAGMILAENTDIIEIETVPEVVLRIPEESITETKLRVPADCALNNIRGCNEGIWLTIIVTISAYSLALVIGLIFGLFRVSGVTLLVNISTAYVEFVRGIPLAVLLVIFAFVIGPQLRDAGGIVGDVATEVYTVLDAFERAVFGTESLVAEAVIGLAVGYGAFLAEIFRAGIQSIHRGQIEASRSLGMSYLESMRHVILPQAIRIILPPLGNDFIAMLKDTSLIAFLALPDLFQRGRADASSSFQIIDVYIGVAVYYVVMTLILSLFVRFVERTTRLP